MAGLAREIEQKVPAFNQRGHGGRVPDIRQFNRNAVADIIDIEKIAAVFGDETVHQGNFGVAREEAPGEGGTDKAETAGHEDIGAAQIFS